MKKVLGLDLGTNSIGWALVETDFDKKEGEILGLNSRIIPMDQGQLTDFEKGNSVSATKDRTLYRGVRRLYQRDNLRRERLHRVLNILDFLPAHYKHEIDFDKKKGQFKKEVKLNYRKNQNGKYEFLFMESFNEMVADFRKNQPELFYTKKSGEETNIPYDWTLYYLRKKALTQKLTKEELAWLILNFNQKRGYYQLRREEEEIQEGKTKTFEILKVKEVVDSGEVLKKTGEKLYNIIFENGWEYDRTTTKPENWVNKTKEYIVTTSKTKDGTIKRTFKAVDSEKDWIAIKKKTEQDLDTYIKQDENHTVGTYIYKMLLRQPTQKIRGKLIKTIERKYYKQELQKILDKQIELQPELFKKDLYNQCIQELYPQNDAHRNNLKDKDFNDLLVKDIIFYQRPLKSKKSTICGCQYEKRPMRDKKGKLLKDENGNQVYKPVQAISKSHPLYQEFRLWQWLQNLRIYQNYDEKGNLIDKDITTELLKTEQDYTNLFDWLNDRADIKQSVLTAYFFKKKAEKENHRWKYPEDKTYPLNKTRAEMLKRLKKVSEINPQEFLTKAIEQKLWHIIYSVKDPNKFEKALETFAKKNKLNETEFKEAFIKHPPYKNDYGAYSEKALKKLLPLMRMGKYWNENDIKEEVKERIYNIMERVNALNLPVNVTKKQINEAFEKRQVTDDDIPRQLIKSFIPFKDKNPLTGLNTYQAGYAVYNRHSEIGDIQKWKTTFELQQYINNFKQHSLRNPIVEQVVLETLRTVKDIWEFYAKKYKVEAFKKINPKSKKLETYYHRFFDEIHIELGRELKNSAGVREQLSKRNQANQNTNERIRLLLKELINDGAKPHSPSHQEILKIYEEGVCQSLDNINDDIEKIRKNNSPKPNDIIKYKLWLEQGYISPYTGKVIPLSKLFTSDYQKEHIIPQSRYFNDSMSNKVICESEVNSIKDNQTAYEFIQKHGGEKINLGQGKSVEILKFEQYQSHCNKYFKSNKGKLNNLLADEIPEGFINRQLNDSRYISKLVKNLLGNIVRQDGEQEATPKNLISVTGAITSKLKQDWGLNDKWNELIMPRFKRLQKMFPEQEFVTKNTNGIEIPTVPDELKKGFNKKRIDHRHHALDAIVIASCTKEHINYINSINSERKNHSLVSKLRKIEEIEKINNKNGEREKRKVAKEYLKPWESFPVDTKKALDNCIVTFKQNLRVINRTNNKYWKYVDGKKQLVRQKGMNFAIRKSMHTPLPYGKKSYQYSILEISKNIGKRNLIIDDEIKTKIEDIFVQFGNIGETQKELKKNPILDKNSREIKFCSFATPETRYRKRKPITDLANRKQGGIKDLKGMVKFINKVADLSLRKDLFNHLSNNGYDIDKSFDIDGINNFNSQRKTPVYRLPIAEQSTKKFPLGNRYITSKKFGEADGDSNLFFTIYKTTNKKGETKRVFETVPLIEVIKHQKQQANESVISKGRTPVPINHEKGKFLFTLSPNDLVYVPTDEEITNHSLVDFDNLSKEQMGRIYNVNDFSTAIYFTPLHLATNIAPKEVDLTFDDKNGKLKGSFDTKTASAEGKQIKDICWKLKTGRLGNIIEINR